MGELIFMLGPVKTMPHALVFLTPSILPRPLGNHRPRKLGQGCSFILEERWTHSGPRRGVLPSVSPSVDIKSNWVPTSCNLTN